MTSEFTLQGPATDSSSGERTSREASGHSATISTQNVHGDGAASTPAIGVTGVEICPTVPRLLPVQLKHHAELEKRGEPGIEKGETPPREQSERQGDRSPTGASPAPGSDSSNAITALLIAMEENGVAHSTQQLMDVDRLERLLKRPELTKLVDAYDQLELARDAAGTRSEPFLTEETLQNRRDLAITESRAALATLLEDVGKNEEEDGGLSVVEDQLLLDELENLLTKSHMAAVMETFDQVESQREEADAPKTLSPVPTSPTTTTSNPNERPMKQVGIRRNPNEKLGIVLKQEDGNVLISRILVGLGADRQGLLHVGDVLCEVDGVRVIGNLELAEEQIRKADGSFTVKLIPSAVDAIEHAPLFYRALFEYDPTSDPDHPYQSGGLAFKTGDVLEVVNSEDASWWQARLAGSDNRKTGLIPARGMQERRLAAKRRPSSGGTGNGNDGNVGCLGMRRSKPKTVMYSSAQNADYDRHELITYEEVVKSGPSQRNVVALIGAQGVGRRGLKYRLINSAKEKYATTLPTTSRPKRQEEEDGVQYYFTNNDTMARDIKTTAYLEGGEYNGFLYGTKTESVRDVIKEGKVCLLDVNPNALKRLRNGEFRPYVIFIKAPDFETLKKMHKDAAAASNQESANAYTDQDLNRTIQESDHIEKLYRHQFDAAIVNDDIEATYLRLQEQMQLVDNQEQWVPACWMV